MVRHLRITAVLLFLTGSSSWSWIPAQQPVSGVVDHVELPALLNSFETDPLLKGSWYLQFQENWQVSPENRSILKEVVRWLPANQAADGITSDSLLTLFSRLLLRAGSDGKPVRIRDVSYEFVLLDPHHTGSADEGAAVPDSMDAWSRNLQYLLIGLIETARGTPDRYDFPAEMLSVQFHEEWTVDPESLQITKEVTGITPVIWQRRQTVEGEPVDEFETGYPVYYKNVTTLISLRNP